MVYFDYASSTPLDEEVLDSYTKVLKTYFANSSAIHYEGLKAHELLEKARSQIASIIKVNPSEVFFTSGASESNNMAIKGIAFKYQSRGKHLITSKVEHPSVLKVFEQLQNEFGFDVTYLDVNEDGFIDLENVKKHLRDDTILVSLMFVNNETGAITNVEEIAKYIKQNYPKCYFHTDATQGFGKLDLNLECIDLMSMSAHKIYGLKGSGLLVKKDNISLSSLIAGGSQEQGLRAGTSNLATDVALAKTIRLQFEHYKQDYEHVLEINNRFRELIKDNKDVLINSPKNASPYVINISIKDKKSAISSQFLEDNGFIVSTTSACGSSKNVFSYVIEDMYPDTKRSYSSIRISFSKFNKIEEVENFAKLLDNIASKIIGE